MRYMKVLPILILAAALAVAPAFAGRSTLAAGGVVTVTVPANQYINVFTTGTARVYKQSGGPSSNTPIRFAEETSSPVVGNEVTFGPYTANTMVKISADATQVLYNVGALAVANPILDTRPRLTLTQFSPATYNTTASFVSNDLMKGLVTVTHTTGATMALTLPTGALLDAASGLKVNQAFEWGLINLSLAAADSVTITASSGHTIVGDAVVISTHVTTGGAITSRGCSSSRWITRKTAADTFVTYRK